MAAGSEGTRSCRGVFRDGCYKHRTEAATGVTRRLANFGRVVDSAASKQVGNGRDSIVTSKVAPGASAEEHTNMPRSTIEILGAALTLHAIMEERTQASDRRGEAAESAQGTEGS